MALFDFFSGIANGVENAVKSVFNPNPPVSSTTPTPPTPTPPANFSQMSVPPNMSTTAGPATGYINSNTVTFNTPSGTLNVPSSKLSTNSTPYIPGVTAPLPSAPTVRQATIPASTPPPNNGFTSSNSSLYHPASYAPPPPPPQGTTGSSGTGGLPTYNSSGSIGGSLINNGTMGSSGVGSRMFSVGAGPLGMYNSPNSGVSSNDQNSKNISTLPTFGGASVGGNLLAGNPMFAGVGNPAASITNGVVSSILTPLSSKAPPTLPMSNVPSTVNAGTVDKNITTSGTALNIATKSGATGTASQAASDAATQIQQKTEEIQNSKSLGDNPITDTNAQSDFFDSLPPKDAFDYQSWADSFKQANGYPDLLKAKEAASSAIVATTQFYNDLIDTVRNNPDLPKQVANTRINELQRQQKVILDRAQQDLNTYQNSLDAIDKSLNSQLGIVEAQNAENDRKRNNALDILKTMAGTGATLTSDQLSQWSQATGMPASAIKALINKPNYDAVSSNGVTTVWDKNTGQVVNTFGTPTKVTSAGLDYTDPLVQQFALATQNMGPGQQAIAAATLKQYLDSGNRDAAQQYVEKQAISKLPAGQQSDFYGSAKLANDTQRAIDAIDTYTSTSGVYKSLKNRGAPFAGLEQDQAYNALRAKIESFQADKIKQVYGSAVTSTEAAAKNGWLVNFQTDSVDTIKTKLQNMNQQANYDKQFFMNAALGDYSSTGTAPDNSGNSAGTASYLDSAGFSGSASTIPSAVSGSLWDGISSIFKGIFS